MVCSYKKMQIAAQTCRLSLEIIQNQPSSLQKSALRKKSRKKLERASGAVVQYVGQNALFSGEKSLRRKAKDCPGVMEISVLAPWESHWKKGLVRFVSGRKKRRCSDMFRCSKTCIYWAVVKIFRYFLWCFLLFGTISIHIPRPANRSTWSGCSISWKDLPGHSGFMAPPYYTLLCGKRMQKSWTNTQKHSFVVHLQDTL